jgi:hypothetical protein
MSRVICPLFACHHEFLVVNNGYRAMLPNLRTGLFEKMKTSKKEEVEDP